MTSPDPNQFTSDPPTLQRSDVKIPSEILLSVLTPPLLLTVWGGKALSEMFQSLGYASEEVFRGDRLPVLNFPHRETD